MIHCGAKLHFKTVRCADHVCVVRAAFHEGVKHECKCGVRWTQDPVLASAGKTWSEEIDITPKARSLPEGNDEKGDNDKSDPVN